MAHGSIKSVPAEAPRSRESHTDWLLSKVDQQVAVGDPEIPSSETSVTC